MLPIELQNLLGKALDVTLVQDNAVRPARSVTEDKLQKRVLRWESSSSLKKNTRIPSTTSRSRTKSFIKNAPGECFFWKDQGGSSSCRWDSSTSSARNQLQTLNNLHGCSPPKKPVRRYNSCNAEETLNEALGIASLDNEQTLAMTSRIPCPPYILDDGSK